MKFKKIVSLILIGVITVTCLTGCGSKDKTQHRDFEREFLAYGQNGELKCTNCGHIFITRDEAIDIKRAKENEEE